MPVWVWIVIAIAAVVVLGILVWLASAQRRSSQLRDRYGPEYERLESDLDSRRDVEEELKHREERREQFDIKPLPDASRERYLEAWRDVQSQFVDDPRGAIGTADKLLKQAMAERGYPIEDFEQRAADLSVRPSGGRAELPRGPSHRRDEQARRGVDRRPPPGAEALSGALRRARRPGTRALAGGVDMGDESKATTMRSDGSLPAGGPERAALRAAGRRSRRASSTGRRRPSRRRTRSSPISWSALPAA